MPNTLCLRFGLFQLDPAERLLLRGDREIHLASKLFETLLFLVQNAGHLVDKETLMRSVWKGTFVEEGSLAHSISVLRKILSDGTERNRYIETVPRHGYRFIAPVELHEKNPSKEAGLGLPTLHSLAVLPLVNLSQRKNQDYFADGMTEALITGLAQIAPLRVISRTSVMAYANARKPLPLIAKELNVDGIVEGTVLRSGRRVRVTAQLLHAPTDRHLWASSYNRDLRDVLTLQKELAESIANEIGGH
jgi:TolB-like protein